MIISLEGKWEIKDKEGKYKFTGNVPGLVQDDLISQKLVPHPYVGINEKYMRDLETRSWIYTKEFELGILPTEDNIELVFEGIDTLSDIYLNETYLGSTEDMFLEYRFNIKDVLKKGKNILKVYIKSPVSEPKILEKMYGKLGATEDSVRSYIRKAQYSYGWDWGARIVTSGIWKSVYIEAYKKARLSWCTADLKEMYGEDGIVEVSGCITSSDKFENIENFQVEIRVDGKVETEFPIEYSGDCVQFRGTFPLKDIRLWFPNSMGKQELYNFEFVLKDKEEEVYKEKKRIGLRTVRLIKEKNAEGESFVFAINGKQVFAKGANWIPADNILNWIKPEDYRKLIYMAKNAGMNMLRVWGGGIYDSEEFYSLCDELGIMVWQDFMFACAEYPDHLNWFRKLCNKEVRETVRKLRYHPSIVLWCGNNENNWGFEEWPFMTHKVDGAYLGNRLYLEDFPLICAQEDSSRPYWPSSPFGGDRANSTEYGDRHVWNVWSNWVDYKAYAEENGRFISEFGFQAAPDEKTINFFAKKEEQEIFNPVMLSHNKQIEGQERIMRFINTHFGLVNDFESFLYLSQLNQAEAIKFGVEHWRTEKYRTAGTLYWQLNDSWPAFSWSSVDYFKRPKALYYYTKKFYSDILPVICYEGSHGPFKIKIVNDRHEEVLADVLLQVWRTEGEKILEKNYGKVRILEDFVSVVDVIDVGKFSKDDLSDMVAYILVRCGTQVYDNYFFFNNFRDVHLFDPEVSYSREGDYLTFQCKKPAVGVYIYSEEEYAPSDNYFTLVPDMHRTIECPSDRIRVKSLYDYLYRKT